MNYWLLIAIYLGGSVVIGLIVAALIGLRDKEDA